MCVYACISLGFSRRLHSLPACSSFSFLIPLSGHGLLPAACCCWSVFILVHIFIFLDYAAPHPPLAVPYLLLHRRPLQQQPLLLLLVRHGRLLLPLCLFVVANHIICSLLHFQANRYRFDRSPRRIACSLWPADVFCRPPGWAGGRSVRPAEVGSVWRPLFTEIHYYFLLSVLFRRISLDFRFFIFLCVRFRVCGNVSDEERHDTWATNDDECLVFMCIGALVCLLLGRFLLLSYGWVLFRYFYHSFSSFYHTATTSSRRKKLAS